MSELLKKRQQELIQEFSEVSHWEDRYRMIIKMGRQLPALSDDKRNDENLVKGCQSRVWLTAEMRDGRVVFSADSDAMIVRGLVALLLRVYSDAKPDDILSTPPDFIGDLGFESNLSANRTNGLYAMLRQMIYFATAFKALTAKA